MYDVRLLVRGCVLVFMEPPNMDLHHSTNRLSVFDTFNPSVNTGKFRACFWADEM